MGGGSVLLFPTQFALNKIQPPPGKCVVVSTVLRCTILTTVRHLGFFVCRLVVNGMRTHSQRASGRRSDNATDDGNGDSQSICSHRVMGLSHSKRSRRSFICNEDNVIFQFYISVRAECVQLVGPQDVVLRSKLYGKL